MPLNLSQQVQGTPLAQTPGYAASLSQMLQNPVGQNQNQSPSAAQATGAAIAQAQQQGQQIPPATASVSQQIQSNNQNLPEGQNPVPPPPAGEEPVDDLKTVMQKAVTARQTQNDNSSDNSLPTQDFSNGYSTQNETTPDNSSTQDTQEATPKLDKIQNSLGAYGQGLLFSSIFDLIRGGPEGGDQHSDVFANSDQAKTNIDPKINSDINQMSADKEAVNSIGGAYWNNRYTADQAQLAQDEGQRNIQLQSQQTIGIGTPDQSQAYRDSANARGAIAQSINNNETAIKSGNPQQIESTLDGEILQGHLADGVKRIPGATGLLQAASEGKALEWLADPGNVAVASKVQGLLIGDYDNATVEATNTDRIRKQILPNSDDTSSRDYQIAKRFDPLVGLPNAGLPNRNDYIASVNSLTRPGPNSFNQQGVNQAGDQGTAQGRAMMETTINELGGAFKEASPAVKKALVTALNATAPGLGDRLEQLNTPATNFSNYDKTTQQAIKDAQAGNPSAQHYLQRYNIKWN